MFASDKWIRIYGHNSTYFTNVEFSAEMIMFTKFKHCLPCEDLMMFVARLLYCCKIVLNKLILKLFYFQLNDDLSADFLHDMLETSKMENLHTWL